MALRPARSPSSASDRKDRTLPRPCPSCCVAGTPVPGSWCCAFREESDLVLTRDSDGAEFPMIYEPSFDHTRCLDTPTGELIPSFYAELDVATGSFPGTVKDRLYMTAAGGGCDCALYRWDRHFSTGEYRWCVSAFGTSASVVSCSPVLLLVYIGTAPGTITGSL